MEFRSKLKKIPFIYKGYKDYLQLREKMICLISYFSPKWVSKIRYKKAFGRSLNLKQPTEFNEKLMWLKLNTYYKNPLVTKCADKVRVREYVKEKNCQDILIECLGVYATVEEIPWGKLPEQFVLKCNHGSGYNIICTDKSKLNIREAEEKLRRWMKEDYSLAYAEVQYRSIRPLILCEKYIQPEHGKLPDDYKIYCFDGRAECVLLCQGRGEGECKFYYFNRKWEPLDWDIEMYGKNKKAIKKPMCFEKLISYAEVLSQGFPFVRMDFYVIGSQVYFGEMTFTPCGCVDCDYTELGNRELSKMLRLPVQKA